jgi:hypothetical protein
MSESCYLLHLKNDLWILPWLLGEIYCLWIL